MYPGQVTTPTSMHLLLLGAAAEFPVPSERSESAEPLAIRPVTSSAFFPSGIIALRKWNAAMHAPATANTMTALPAGFMPI